MFVANITHLAVAKEIVFLSNWLNEYSKLFLLNMSYKNIAIYTVEAGFKGPKGTLYFCLLNPNAVK